VIDVAMTETGGSRTTCFPLHAYEKWERVLHLEFPHNSFSCGAILEPLAGHTPEPRFHHRLVRALGGISDDDLAPRTPRRKQALLRSAFSR